MFVLYVRVSVSALQQTNKQTSKIIQKLEANPFKWACLYKGLAIMIVRKNTLLNAYECPQGVTEKIVINPM